MPNTDPEATQAASVLLPEKLIEVAFVYCRLSLLVLEQQFNRNLPC